MSRYLTLLVCLFTAALPGQTEAIDTTRAAFVAYWSVGDSYSFEVSKISNVYVNDVNTKSDTIRYRSTFEVVDSTAEQYTIKYTFGQTYTNTQATDPAVAEALDSFALDHLLYTTDTYGRFQRLTNWEPFAAAMEQGFRAGAVSAMAGRSEADVANYEQIIAPLRAAYATESGILNKVVGELQHFHMFYGGTYRYGDTLRFEDQLGNMYAADTPYPVASEVFLEALNYADDFAVVRYYNTLQPAATDIFRKTLRNNYPDIASREGHLFDAADFDVRDDNWYAFYYYPGIPYRIENDRWTTTTVADTQTVNHERLLVSWVD